MAAIELSPGADENGLATMVATLIAQNLADDPRRARAFERLAGRVAIVAEDANAATTLDFRRGRLVVHDGIVGIPDLTIRGGYEQIGDMSRMERLGPLPDPRGPVNRALARALRQGKLRIHGLPRALPILVRMGVLLAVR
jgi:hypothetical protein